jgi:hypothetical protein
MTNAASTNAMDNLCQSFLILPAPCSGDFTSPIWSRRFYITKRRLCVANLVAAISHRQFDRGGFSSPTKL